MNYIQICNQQWEYREEVIIIVIVKMKMANGLILMIGVFQKLNMTNLLLIMHIYYFTK